MFKRFVSIILAILMLISVAPLSALAVKWSDSTYHEDQDESPKISYQKAYSYLAGYEETTGNYAVRCVNSPRPAPTAADNYPDSASGDYWKATSDAPYFAVSYKMTVNETAMSSGNSSWQEGGDNGGKSIGGTDQSWYYPGSSSIDKNPRMGISLGYTWNDDKGSSVGWGYTYGFFGFAYSKITKTTSDGGYTEYSDPVLVFGPTGYEADIIDDNDSNADEAHKSPFYKNKYVVSLSEVPVYDEDGKAVTRNFVNTENVIMLVGSYINNVLTLKAYINGYQIRKIWGSSDTVSKDTFSFTDYPDYTYRSWGTTTFHSAFRGQFGFVTQLNETFAYARFTRASHPLDQNAFNVHHAKVDASRPEDSNTNWYNDQANQWKVDMKHFAVQYTIYLDRNKTYSYVDSGKDLDATSLNCGLVFGRQSRDPDKLLGTVDFRFTKTGDGDGTCKWIDDQSKLWFGPDNHGTVANKGGTLGLEFRQRKHKIDIWEGTNDGTSVYFSMAKLLIVGDYDAENKKATIKVWLNGELINSWFNEETITINNFGDGLNYIGWRTNVKGVEATARFTQWDEDANLDYAAEHGTVFDEKTAGPMTGYWDRTVEQNKLAWGEDTTDTFDSVSYRAYNEAWEGYEHPNNNAYQLGMITDASRSFVVQADIPYWYLKGFYITAEAPTDYTNDGLNIGMSDGGMDDIRKWYNEYYYIQLRDTGHITTWVNVGDGDAYDSRWIIPDVCYGSDTISVNNVFKNTYTKDDNNKLYIGVRVEYSNKKLSIWVKEGGEANPNSEYVHLYTINNLDNPNIAETGNRCDSTASNALFKGLDDYTPIYFGIMTNDGGTAATSEHPDWYVDFKNVKVSYGLQSPSEIYKDQASDNKIWDNYTETTEGGYLIGMTFDNDGKVTGRNANIVAFAQTREGTNAETYDLRVAVEGDDIGLYRAQGYDAVIRVVFKGNDLAGEDTRSKSSFSHHWAYYEFSFYDAEYYFHAADGCGLISAVFTNIPVGYTNFYVFVDFYEKGESGLGNQKVRVYLGRGDYSGSANTLHGAGGSPAPSIKNGTENVDKENENASKNYSVRPAKNQRYYLK